MNAKDTLKLLNAGFTVIRKSETHTYPNGINKKPVIENIAIKYKDVCHHEWCIFEKDFKSLVARQRRMDALLKDPKTVED